MTIKECIDAVDNIKPNQYSIKEKVQWLSFIDEIIINDVLRTHEGYDGRYDNFEGYSEDRLSEPLIVGSPYDRLYTAYLKMKIDEENGEMAKYNNSAAMFNAYLMEYRKHYNKTHMPLDVTKNIHPLPQNKKPSNISDAVYENMKRELYALLSEEFADMVSDNKIYDIVMRFVNNNLELLTGSVAAGENGEIIINGKVIKVYDDTEIRNKNNACNVAYVSIKGGLGNWKREDITNKEGLVVGSRYGQTVQVNNAVITPNSKVDLQMSSEQMVVFYEKSLAFVAENDNGVITVYCVGTVPQNDYTMQVIVTEVAIDG